MSRSTARKAPDGNLTGWLLPPHPFFAGEDVPVAGAEISAADWMCCRNEKTDRRRLYLPPGLMSVSAVFSQSAPIARLAWARGGPPSLPINRAAPRLVCRQLRRLPRRGAERRAGEAPPLAGTTFMAAWGNRSTEELYNLVKASMPYGNGNGLDDEMRIVRIIAYVLAANGAKPGDISMTGNESGSDRAHRRWKNAR